ncbi:MAG: peptidylprolyl isomerase, partial [Planctomycetota bacterium]
MGRELFVSYRSDLPPFALGLRLVFFDPDAKTGIAAVVSPLLPPRPPLALFRERAGVAARPKSAAGCDVRFRFEEDETFTAELRLPLDTLEIGRTAKPYGFSFQVWDLGDDRAIGAYPVTAQGPMLAPQLAQLSPQGDWGSEAPVPGPAPVQNPALKLLEEVHREAEGAGSRDSGEAIPPLLAPYLGFKDGRRKEAPLRELEKRLCELAGGYPDYVSLQAVLLRVRVGLSDYEGALETARAMPRAVPSLHANFRQAMVELQLLQGLGRYEEAIAYFDANAERMRIGPESAMLRATLVSQSEASKRELESRAEEVKRDDLPRVRFETTKGAIVLELFEDDAPNAVANFVSLVEKSYYDGTRFHWAEGGARVAGGDPNSRDDDPLNDGYGGPGYLIESEPSRRLHLPYTIAFADLKRTRRSEGSSFVIHISPNPAMDGVNSVFGRVIEGQDVVRRLEHYDTLTAAKVVRKRALAYVPATRCASVPQREADRAGAGHQLAGWVVAARIGRGLL